MNFKRSEALEMLRLLFFVFVVITFYSCGSGNSGGETGYVKMVKTARAERVPLKKEMQFPGIMEADQEINLAFRVAGPILKYHVKEGDNVSKGALLVEMDPRDYEVQKLAVETQVKQLQSEYNRIKELNDRESVADNDFEKMKAGKELAEAKLKNAVDQLKDTRLYAPFSGFITKVNYDNGELIDRGMPVVTMIATNQLKVEINVPASLYLQKDQITKIEGTQEDLPGETYPLVLYADAKKANSSGLYTLYLAYNGTKDSRLTTGMNISVNVFVNSSDTSLVSIPAQALFERDGNTCVWVVVDSTVTARPVEAETLMYQGNIHVRNGLQPGEEVVTGGLNLLSEGEKVKVVQPVSKSNVGNLL